MSTEAAPRITPGTRREVGFVAGIFVLVASRSAGSRRPLNAFMTLARHRRLFGVWLRFSRQLIRRGALPPVDAELVVLRVARNCDCEYEWQRHLIMARQAGVSEESIDRVVAPVPAGFDRRHTVLLRAADELHGGGCVSDATWAELSEFLSDIQLIELCMLVGHYEMLAMTLKSLGVVPDPT